jgi:hypothetical protein
LTFLVDPGSEITVMSANEASAIGLPLPLRASVGAVHGQTGLEIRSGYLRVQVVGMDRTEYALPCFFLGDPQAPPPASCGVGARKLLGLGGVIDKLRLTFDGRPTAGATHGNLIVEKI